ncbi:hypothetical protein Q3G72_011173 [Acer saccharum]|nr:hypothetical protein Q3G72_011173 [Acer saccharum]
MDKVKSILKPKVNPQQQLRDWQRKLRQECRNVERQIRDIQREEKSVQKAIKDAAKRNDMVSAKALAKEVLMSRKAVNRLYENKAQLNSISMHLGESVAISRTVGHLSKSAEVMKLVNDLMKAPEMAATMQEFSKEMTKAGVIEEMVNDSLDTALDSDDIEEEIEEEVDRVLTELAGEAAAQLPEAVRKERARVHAQKASTSHEEEALAEGEDDEEELEALRARLQKSNRRHHSQFHRRPDADPTPATLFDFIKFRYTNVFTKKTSKMQQRKSSASGRPSGTDGSDFSYRMVVDSRYTKVAKGKSRLSTLILTQAAIQLIGVLYTYLLTSKEESPNTLAISSASACLFSLLVGELGRKRSRVNFLRVSMVTSSIAILLSVFSVVKTNSTLEVIKNPSDWVSKKLELLETALVLLGSLVQIFLVSTIISLIGNMSPPKKSS